MFYIILGQTNIFSQANVADNQSKNVLIKLKDGSTVQGRIVLENSLEINLATDNIGTLTIKKDQIKSLVPLDSTNFKKGKYWFPNPNYSRYFISPGIQL
jgi:small nuclear ribonucleoprotein (snRNP)-like protein